VYQFYVITTVKKMEFLNMMQTQTRNLNLSIGELRVNDPYTIISIRKIDTAFGIAVICVLRDGTVGGTVNIFLPKTIQMFLEDIQKYNDEGVPPVNLVFKGMNKRSFVIEFQ